jgi:hypothetical protein
VLTKRDQRMLKFTEDFHIARTRDLWQLAFSDTSLRRCQQRLTTLVKQKRIKRYRDYVAQDYLYYVGKKPDQVEHDLLRVEVFLKLKKHDLQEFKPEYTCGHLRSDGYFEIGDDPWFLEIQLSSGFNQEKYEALYRRLDWRELWPEFPNVMVIAAKAITIEPSDINFKVIRCDLVGLDTCVDREHVGSCRVQIT